MKISTNKLSQISLIIAREFRAISTSYAVLLVLMGGIFVYGLLYNYMYAPNIVTDAPVAVVDNSRSSLSRQFIRWLNATPQISVYAQAEDYREAKEWMKEGDVQGIIYIPYDFEKRVFQGEEAVFSLYATTDAFLYFEALQEASSRVMLAVNDAYRPDGALFLPPQGLLAIAMAKPINVSGTPLYNVTEGYGSYLIPAVMMVIIFQTLLMVIGMLTGDEYQDGSLRQYAGTKGQWGTAMRLVAGKTFVYIGLYAIFALFLLGLLPHFFSIPNIGSGLDIFIMLIPYLLATSFFGLAVSRWFTDSEAPLLMIAFFSVGLIFLSGVSYPLELMPWYWRAAHYVIPAAPGTLAFVKINSMDASMADIRPEYITLWVQTIVYFLLAVWVYRLKLAASARRLLTGDKNIPEENINKQ
ncbi:ABC transporter permease [Oscillospiraceae bacterium N12]|jgi:ABC-2 type transport system permease protein|uniref:ABC transporter permease n=1 Tax=Jilunia laotingensis TaxID=2763675 RepID=A0A926IQI7_9BACT|nr:ABC transporter permease [Jilunia laotingensis]MBC8594359.1 ABC transporter permease [Jilunia laotingensis]